MPIYDYACKKCKRNFELLIMGTTVPVCPHCGATRLQALMSAPAAPDGLPPAPDIDEPLDMAHLSVPDPAASSDVSVGPGRGPDAGLPPAPIGETNPTPPVLPAGAAPSVDMEPTSAMGDHDN